MRKLLLDQRGQWGDGGRMYKKNKVGRERVRSKLAI